jgi:hypothetical protein
MLRGKVAGRAYWEIELKIIEKKGSEFWSKIPPRDPDEWEKRKKKYFAEEIAFQSFLEKATFRGWKMNYIIANRFDPFLANRNFRIAIDFRKSSRMEEKVLDLFFWTWITIDRPLSRVNRFELIKKIRSIESDKRDLFTE